MCISPGAIKPSDKFKPHLPCGVVHPGHCRANDDIVLTALSKRFDLVLASFPLATLFALQVVYEGVDEPELHYRCLASRLDAVTVQCAVTLGLGTRFADLRW